MTIPMRHVAIVGTGVIGASWATAFLARGMDVTASDPAPGAEAAFAQSSTSNGARWSRWDFRLAPPLSVCAS